MRATRARRNGSLSCRRALLAMAGILLAGAAWAGTGQPADTAANQLAAVPEGSSQPPAITPAPHATLSAVSADMPRGASGGDDRRLLMLMMLGKVSSGGAFGRLGQ